MILNKLTKHEHKMTISILKTDNTPQSPHGKEESDTRCNCVSNHLTS